MPDSQHPQVFDPFTPVADPYTPLKEAADKCPVFAAKGGAVVVTGTTNVRAVFTDAESFRSELRPPSPGAQPSMVHLDGPEHTRMRKLVVRAFTPRAVKRLVDPTHAIANGLVDNFIARGRADLSAEFAFSLPAMVIAELVGIPAGDRGPFIKWADDAVAAAGPDSSGYAESDAELREYVLGIIDQRRREPGEDLLSDLVQIHDDGDSLTTEELVAVVRMLILAGTDTTSNLIGSMLHYLLSERSRWERLSADRTLIPNVIEETLRIDPPLYWVPRKSAVDVEMAGVVIPSGTMVCNAVGHANRDPEVVTRPDEWDMERPAAENRTHWTFGFGEHFCIGSALARMEAAAALEVLLDRIPDVGLADDYNYFPHGPMMMRGVKAMPVTFTPTQ
ncbi:cytochrome P450 [[Mycobacterium] vasticus]|uniref:Cytochrome P450 n=1 Tax=[Mycobacterium] vasticus TaxID=2875777 RepID=A0ABU5YZW9_9MYCO|nr:cytochrome P450 [Mycolicibacter sp. MYC017]MEB3070675.1 cytochrome P450 [Mycolicibacter sp. MYC017]